MNQDELDEKLKLKFDPESWQGHTAFRSYKHAGINLVDEINALDPDLVIEVGCGHNRFKGHIQNLIGFDQQPFPFADLHMSTDHINFRRESADAILCLGSVQFGGKETVERHLDKIVSWLKPGGYMVMRTMLRHVSDYPYQDIHYIWSNEDIEYFTEKYGLKIVQGPWEDKVFNKRKEYISNRVVWWWQKPGERKKYNIDPITCDIQPRT